MYSSCRPKNFLHFTDARWSFLAFKRVCCPMNNCALGVLQLHSSRCRPLKLCTKCPDVVLNLLASRQEKKTHIRFFLFSRPVFWSYSRLGRSPKSKCSGVAAAKLLQAGCRSCRPTSSIKALKATSGLEKQVRKVLSTRKGVRATVVTAGHCTHAGLTSRHALASCYSCCVHSRGLC